MAFVELTGNKAAKVAPITVPYENPLQTSASRLADKIPLGLHKSQLLLTELLQDIVHVSSRTDGAHIRKHIPADIIAVLAKCDCLGLHDAQRGVGISQLTHERKFDQARLSRFLIWVAASGRECGSDCTGDYANDVVVRSIFSLDLCRDSGDEFFNAAIREGTVLEFKKHDLAHQDRLTGLRQGLQD